MISLRVAVAVGVSNCRKNCGDPVMSKEEYDIEGDDYDDDECDDEIKHD